MTPITRRRFTSLCASASLLTCSHTGLLSCTEQLPVNPSPLTDKLRAMILLGTYGDALGALHEPSGLQGNTGNPDSARTLSPVSAYQPAGNQGAPWWVWLDGDDIPQDSKGVPTDDSAFRLTLLHPWLTELADQTPSEPLFRTWLKNQLEPGSDAPTDSWQGRRQAQIRDWILMLDDAERWSALSEGEDFTVTNGNPFFRPGIPVVFGIFMYLECAALFSRCGPMAVRNRFATFCSLDQGYAGEITGLFAGLIASASSASPSEQSFSQWYIQTLGALLTDRDISLADSNLSEVIESTWRFGMSLRSDTETDMLQAIRTNIYEAPLPGSRDALGYRVFDPLLFLKQITATVAYAEDNIPQILTLLASNPGDADTVPSIFGSIAGTWYGLEALRTRSPSLSDDLDHVQRTLATLFDYDLEAVVHSLARLSQQIRCT